MATQTLYTTGTTSFSKGEISQIWRYDYFLDFTVATVANGDVLKIIALPKGSYVIGTFVTINTASTASTTMSVGDSGSGTRYSTTLDVTQAAGTEIAPTSYTAHAYTAVDYISVTVAGASPTVGQVTISVLVADMSGLTHLAAKVATL